MNKGYYKRIIFKHESGNHTVTMTHYPTEEDILVEDKIGYHSSVIRFTVEEANELYLELKNKRNWNEIIDNYAQIGSLILKSEKTFA